MTSPKRFFTAVLGLLLTAVVMGGCTASLPAKSGSGDILEKLARDSGGR